VTSPRFSILTPVYNTPLPILRDTIASVLAQTFTDWEWVCVDDRSPEEAVRTELRALAARDPRVRLIEREANGGIVAASNDCVDAATGEFFVLLDHDDLLVDTALEKVDAALSADETIDYLYTDEDKHYPDGSLRDAFRKPDWSPERLRNQMYTSHLSVLRGSLVREVGGFHSGFEGSQDHDLILRVTERARRVWHVREVLYHWRIIPGSAAGDATAKPYAWDSGVRAVAAHVERLGLAAAVTHGRGPGHYRVERKPDVETPVSVVIPARMSTGMVWGERRIYIERAVESILRTTHHRNVEFVIVHDASTPPVVLERLRAIPDARLTLVESPPDLNISRKCNLGFLAARGEIVVFLSDDTEVLSPGALELLIAPLAEPDVGMTGARLLSPDMTHQHAGITYGDGFIENAYTSSPVPSDAPGVFADLWINREVSALSAACCAIRRQVFEEVGGFCEELSTDFFDVDLSMKLRSHGMRLVWLQDVWLFHFESRTRIPGSADQERELLIARWGKPLGADKYALSY
jgi:GT2 family glycosyltransferase